MGTASVRDLRNRGGEVIARVQRGERVVITSSGRPVAELRPLRPEPLSLEVLIKRRRRLPKVDPASLRRDVDAVVDQRIF